MKTQALLLRGLSAARFSLCVAWVAAAALLAQAVAHAAILVNGAPRTMLLDTTAPAAQWLPQVVPAGARLIHGPVVLAFGAHASGQLLAWRTAEGGYAVVYLTPEGDAQAAPAQPPAQRWLWLREPRESDFGFDIELRAALSVGPALARDIVLLESYSRPAPAGGQQQTSATVYRRVGGGVKPVPEMSALLGEAADAATVRKRLAPAYAKLLPQVPGHLASLFASLPWPWVQTTALERLQQLQVGNPLFKTYDSKNGFLEIRGDAGTPGYQAALFKHADGGWLLALQKRWPDNQRTWFLRPETKFDMPGMAWVDVSAEVMPGFAPEANYVLPQTGRMVSVNGGGMWEWNGKDFSLMARPR